MSDVENQHLVRFLVLGLLVIYKDQDKIETFSSIPSFIL